MILKVSQMHKAREQVIYELSLMDGLGTPVRSSMIVRFVYGLNEYSSSQARRSAISIVYSYSLSTTTKTGWLLMLDNLLQKDYKLHMYHIFYPYRFSDPEN